MKGENEKLIYVVTIKCLSYEDAKKTRELIYQRMGYRGFVDKIKDN